MKNISWEENYELLKEYLKESGGKYPASTEAYKGIYLYSWIKTQKTIYKKGEKSSDGSYTYRDMVLTMEQFEKLNDINFAWFSQKHKKYDKMWDDTFELLKEYLKEHNGKYPKYRETYKGVNLGIWVSNQRTVYNNGIRQNDGSFILVTSHLTKERINKLNEINFIWHTNDWIRNYKLLEEYLNVYGKYPNREERYKEILLGKWIYEIRTIYNNGIAQDDGSIKYRSYVLTKDEIEMLNKISFIWVPLTKRECHSVINNEKKEKLIKRKVLYRQKKVLEQAKKEIESIEDIKTIEKQFIKSLSL